ncbi:TM0106 family RecB-like putative nuclease [Cellulosimicrobium arenosum]|uniref:TM0106 family RecB-like putative nuclease n=1 Tax=Cellulosimicrobium arenosum TaxID=2708133 RepID=A0A927G7Y7_9MICO|nr:bifunctional RecB family nuclease/DEAD/DEAH box helicase [Cellulosimicrobium arenosum]MBD8078553.1 TM0106 family RecB-like putative nuclease [Cellulosimicrobium arenosum]
MFLLDDQTGRGPGREPGRAPGARARVVVHSATDLVVAAGCEYRLLAGLDARLGRAPSREPVADPMLERAGSLGERHEQVVLAQYVRRYGHHDRTTGQGVARIEAPRHLGREELVTAHAQTLAALEGGADVVHQGVLFDGTFYGRADFLVRSDDADAAAGGDGMAAYAVVEARLARRAKVPALLQAAAYADQLVGAGVPVADEVSLVLGTGARTTHRLADLLPVYRDRRDRLRTLVDQHVARDAPAPWDHPGIRSCGRCEACVEQIEARRDVLLVGGVYENQRTALRAGGITTIDELATATDPPRGMSGSAFRRVRDQAALQLGTGPVDGTVTWSGPSGTHRLSWRIDDATPVHALPAPSPGDLFFDFEGDPLWADADGTAWGIDYLFGWVERPPEQDASDGEPPFHALWAHDLAAERDALVAFVDHVNARRREHPDLHVYHYAPYEKTHLLSIAARHGVYEDEVDDLLRDGVLVDLYAVVRRALRISDRSRSIKKLEPLYMGDELRTGDVKDGAASIVAYAQYTALRDAGRDDEADELLRGIGDYNRYDCVSTWRLLEWLRWAVSGGSDLRAVASSLDPAPSERAAPARDGSAAERVPSGAAVLEAEIRDVVGEERGARDDRAQALALYGAAAGYFGREAKPFWHEHFARLSLPVEEWTGRRNAFRVEEAAVVREWEVEDGRRTWSRRVELVGRLPEGTDLRAGVAPFLLYDRPLPACARTSEDGVRGWCTGALILEAGRRSTPGGDRDVLLVREQLPTGADPYPMLPMALTPSPGPSTATLGAAAEAVARGALESWCGTGRLPRDASTDLLRRTPPRLLDGDALPPVDVDDLVGTITRAVERLDDSYLAVQGPPGTGKTYVGSHVVARLVDQGWRVGVVAQSHAVVENMLRAVVEKAGVPAHLVAKKRAADGPSRTSVCEELDGVRLAAFAAGPGARVVGGTAWDFASERMPDAALDLLVVDEAGQFSLASTVAVARSARRLLLLGDPQQLPQVSRGIHPEPVDRSALAWLADEHGVLPGRLGYFLPQTRRLHPRLAAAISGLSYEDRLDAHPVAGARELGGVRAGVEQVLVEHTGNAVRSTEEADEVVRQVSRFLGRPWTVPDGAPATRPLDQGDLLVVAAYNAQVWAVRSALAAAGYPDVEVGTVDRFQGREAVVVIVTLAASSAREASRGLGFLLSRRRINVAISRAQWSAVVVRSAHLTDHLPGSPQALEDLGAFLALGGPQRDRSRLAGAAQVGST